MNIAIRIKLYMNVKDTKMTKNVWDTVLTFYDLLSVHENFKNVSKKNFFEIQEKIKNQRWKSKMSNVELLKKFSSLDSSSAKNKSSDN